MLGSNDLSSKEGHCNPGSKVYNTTAAKLEATNRGYIFIRT
jgi:hypothetical protein